MFGRFQLLLEMAQGGMATLFLARIKGPEQFQKLLVIKKIHDHLAQEREFIEMFLDEARIAALIHHPNVVTIFDMGQVKDAHYIAMEYVHGHNLSEIMRAAKRQQGVFPWPHAVRIAISAAAGLQAAHELRTPEGKPLNVVHRDVSPQNILVSYDGHIKVVDFGVAYAAEKISHTMSGTVKGKMAYMSPEQATSQPLDRRSDVFSLGIVLFEVICLRRLFKEETDAATLYRVIEAEVPRPRSFRPDIPADLEKIILKALAKHPEDRFSTAGELEDALDRVLLGHGEVVKDQHVGRLMDTLFHEQRKIKDEQIKQAQLVDSKDPIKAFGMGGEVTSDPRAFHTDSLVQRPAVKKPVPIFALVSLGLLVTTIVFLLAVYVTREKEPPIKNKETYSATNSNTRPPSLAMEPRQTISSKPLASTTVTLRVVIRPTEAETSIWFRNRRWAGPELELKIQPSEKQEQIKIEARGFQTEVLDLLMNRDREILLSLQPSRPRPTSRTRYYPVRRGSRPQRQPDQSIPLKIPRWGR